MKITQHDIQQAKRNVAKNRSIRQRCLTAGILPTTVDNRIRAWQRDYPDWDYDKLVDMALQGPARPSGHYGRTVVRNQLA